MSRHSPGLWRSEVCVDFRTIVDANDKTVAAVFAQESFPLLLAAPDLLDSCELARSQLSCNCGFPCCNTCDTIRQLDAAIKKAKGAE